MIVIHRQKFGVSQYHRECRRVSERDDGLVLSVRIEFEEWLGSEPQAAEAYLDPGSDSSLISMRLIEELTRSAGARPGRPKLGPGGELIERAYLHLGGERLSLGEADYPVVVPVDMPGYEDLILGLDFLIQHGLLVLIDSSNREFSMLLPRDQESRSRRDRIRQMFDSEAELPG